MPGVGGLDITGDQFFCFLIEDVYLWTGPGRGAV